MDRGADAERWMVIGQEGMEMRLVDEFVEKHRGNELTEDGSVVTGWV